MLAGVSDKPQVEAEVVYARYLHGQQLLCLEEMVQVCLCVYAVDMTSERVNRAEVVLPFLVLHVHCALICEEHGVAAVTCRHDTIKHVHSALYRLQDILWCAYSHQIAWLVFRQYIVDHLYHLVHNLCRLPHSESANGIAVSSFVGYVFGRLPSEVWILASLHDREEGLLVAIEGFCLAEASYAAVEPSMGHLH